MTSLVQLIETWIETKLVNSRILQAVPCESAAPFGMLPRRFVNLEATLGSEGLALLALLRFCTRLLFTAFIDQFSWHWTRERLVSSVTCKRFAIIYLYCVSMDVKEKERKLSAQWVSLDPRGPLRHLFDLCLRVHSVFTDAQKLKVTS